MTDTTIMKNARYFAFYTRWFAGLLLLCGLLFSSGPQATSNVHVMPIQESRAEMLSDIADSVRGVVGMYLMKARLDGLSLHAQAAHDPDTGVLTFAGVPAAYDDPTDDDDLVEILEMLDHSSHSMGLASLQTDVAVMGKTYHALYLSYRSSSSLETVQSGKCYFRYVPTENGIIYSGVELSGC